MSSARPDRLRHLIIAAALLPFGHTAQAQTSITFTQLQPFWLGSAPVVAGLDAAGRAYGTAGTLTGYHYDVFKGGFVADYKVKAVTWPVSSSSALRPTALTTDFEPKATNALGHMAGLVRNSVSIIGLYADGTVTELTPVSPVQVFTPRAVNGKDWVVGEVVLKDRPTYPDRFAFVLRDRVVTLLPVPDGFESSAYGINDAGQIIGMIRSIQSGEARAVRWTADRIDWTAPVSSIGVAINGQGSLVLNSPPDINPSNLTPVGRAWVYAGGNLLPVLPELPYVAGQAINAAGEVVGRSNQGAFYWKNGAAQDLTTWARGKGARLPSGATITGGSSINDKGVIACEYATDGSLTRGTQACRLTPSP